MMWNQQEEISQEYINDAREGGRLVVGMVVAVGVLLILAVYFGHVLWRAAS